MQLSAIIWAVGSACGSVRHRPDCGLTISPPEPGFHCWLALPVHGYQPTCAPELLLLPTARPPPSVRIVWSESSDQTWPAVPSQACRSIGVYSVLSPSALVRRSPPVRVT